MFHLRIKGREDEIADANLSVSCEIVGLFSSADVSVSVRTRSKLHLYWNFIGILLVFQYKLLYIMFGHTVH